MTFRKSNDYNPAKCEIAKPEDLPKAIPAKPIPLARRPNGTVASSEAAKALGKRGGRKRATRAAILQGLGLAKLKENDKFHSYWDSVEFLLKAQLTEYATMWGGYISPATQSLVASSYICLAASRYYSDLFVKHPDEVTYFTQARHMMAESRQQLLQAWELGVREAKARQALAKLPTNNLYDIAGIEVISDQGQSAGRAEADGADDSGTNHSGNSEE